MGDNANFSTEKKEIKRQPCQVYTRVMWYLRPVWNYNIGKKSEFYSRKYFKEDAVCQRDNDIILNNREFIWQYS